MSDVVFGSDTPDLIEGYEGFNTGAERPSNSMFGDVIPAGVPGPKLRSIDPRLLLREQVLGEDTSPSACHNQSSNGLPNQMSCPNNSAPTLQEAETTPNNTELSLDTLSYLALWMLLNPGRLPSTTNLKSIENLSHAPGKGKLMMDWLKDQVTVTNHSNRAMKHSSIAQNVSARAREKYCPVSRNCSHARTVVVKRFIAKATGLATSGLTLRNGHVMFAPKP
jgi:hypothetical protein